MKITFTSIALGSAVLAAATFGSAPSYARHGADDPAGHVRQGRGGNDDGPNHTFNLENGFIMQMARRGADDPAGDDRGGRKGRGGNDDGPNHT